MNPEDRRELRLLREEQERLRRIADALDGRIERLTRKLEGPTADLRDPEEIAEPEISAPPPLPAKASVLPEETPLAPEPAAVAATPLSSEVPELPILPQPVMVPELEQKSADSVPRPPEASASSLPAESLELRVGTFWMARVGIVILLTGLVFLGNYAYQRIVPLLGPGGKLTLLALAAGALAGLGSFLERSREATRNYGRVLLAGGVALLYYTAYAAHFVAPLRVIESPWLGGILLLAVGAAILCWADRRRSEPTALLAVLLSYYTSAINPIGTFTLFSNLLLTAAAVFFLIRHQWTRISFASLAATYGSYAFWRFHQVAESGSASQFGVGLTFVAGYWVLFTAAVFLARSETLPGSQRVAFLTANNAAFFAFAAQHFAAHRPGSFWIFALGYGAVLLGLSALAIRRRREDLALDGAFLAQGLALVTLGFAAKLTGPQFAVVLAVESVALLAGSRWRHRLLYEIAAGLCAVGAAGFAWHQLDRTEVSPLGLGLPVAGMLFFNAWWIKHLRSEFTLDRLSKRALGFALLALLVLSSLLSHTVSEPWQPTAFVFLAVASVGVLWIARLPEIVLPAQACLGIGVTLFVARALEGASVSAGRTLPVLAGALALTHWWQHQRKMAVPSAPAAGLQLACASGAVLASICWLSEVSTGDAWLIGTSLAALAALGYALATRAWAVAIAGQAFTVLACGSLILALAVGSCSWSAALAPIANLILTSFLAEFATRRLPAAAGTVSFARLATGYRILAAILLGAWGFEYVTAEWR
ncbi:MAG TPA: DUF2339 domain-containing protein, partial [Chthoniobacteraceae bacterium]